MKTAISLPDELFEAADLLANRLDISRSELYQRALIALLAQHDSAAITEKLDQVYGSDARTDLDPLLAAMQQATLECDPW